MRIRFAAFVPLGAAAGGILNVSIAPLYWNLLIPAGLWWLFRHAEKQRPIARRTFFFQLRVTVVMYALLLACYAALWLLNFRVIVDDHPDGIGTVPMGPHAGCVVEIVMIVGLLLLWLASIVLPMWASLLAFVGKEYLYPSFVPSWLRRLYQWLRLQPRQHPRFVRFLHLSRQLPS